MSTSQGTGALDDGLRQRYALSGILFVLLGAVALSAKGVLAKLLYAEGGDYVTVATVRGVLAVPGFWLWALIAVGPRRLLAVERRSLSLAVLVGLASYYAGSMIDFYALTLIGASLERMLMFTYPSMVVLTLALVERRLPPVRVLASVVLTWVGVALAVGGLNRDLLEANWFGSLLVLAVAAMVAAYYLVNARVSRRIGSQAFTVYAMTAAGAAMGAHLLASGRAPALLTLPAGFWWLMALMVVGVTVLPLFLMGEGVARIGASRGSLISAVGPASTVVLAYAVLGESLSLGQGAGCLLIVVGVLVLERRRRATPLNAARESRTGSRRRRSSAPSRQPRALRPPSSPPRPGG